MKNIVAALLLLLSTGEAFARGRAAGAGMADPFRVVDYSVIYVACNGSFGCNQPFTGATTKTPRNTAINTGVANLVLFVMGQSNNESEAPSAYTPTNGSAIDDFNVYDGSLYVASDPHLGTSWNSTGPGLMDFRLADAFITSGTFARVILVPMAIGGSNVLQWANGGPMQNLPCIALKRLAARGITPGMTNVTFAVDWGQGEAEASLSTSQSTYQTALGQIKTNMQACGWIGRFFVNVETWNNTTYAPAAAAQAAVVDNVFFFAGANLDSLNNSNRVDTTHFNDTGSAAGAALKKTAMHASGAPF